MNSKKWSYVNATAKHPVIKKRRKENVGNDLTGQNFVCVKFPVDLKLLKHSVVPKKTLKIRIR